MRSVDLAKGEGPEPVTADKNGEEEEN